MNLKEENKRKITICLSYYNQADCLKKTVLLWKSYSDRVKRSFTFSIVDDCSSLPATNVLRGTDLSDLDIHIYKVKIDLYCNIAGVRNLAASKCNTEWMVIADMDALIQNELAEKMLSLASLKPKNIAYKFNRKNFINNEGIMEKEKVHPAVCLITKHNYFKVGGCDENLVGKYGGTDGDFWKKWKAAGLYVNVLYDHYLTCDDEGKTLGIDRERGKQGIRIHEPIPSPPEHVRFPWEKVFP